MAAGSSPQQRFHALMRRRTRLHACRACRRARRSSVLASAAVVRHARCGGSLTARRSVRRTRPAAQEGRSWDNRRSLAGRPDGYAFEGERDGRMAARSTPPVPSHAGARNGAETAGGEANSLRFNGFAESFPRLRAAPRRGGRARGGGDVLSGRRYTQGFTPCGVPPNGFTLVEMLVALASSSGPLARFASRRRPVRPGQFQARRSPRSRRNPRSRR